MKCDGENDPGQVSNPRFLVVEDEAILAMYVEDLLLGLGCRVLKAGRVGKALALVGEHQFDGAFLDVSIFGTPVFPLADELSARDIPFAFITGYGADRFPVKYKDYPLLTKPLVEHKFSNLVVTFATYARQKCTRMPKREIPTNAHA